MTPEKFFTIKYFKAGQLAQVDKTPEARALINASNADDNIAVLLSVNSPVRIERAVNVTRDGFRKIRELAPING